MASGQENTRFDLSRRWKVYDEGLNGAAKGVGNTIHFQLNIEDAGTLEILNDSPTSIFINSNLLNRNVKKVSWSLDSLKSIYIFPISVSIFCKKGLTNLSTNLLSQAFEINPRVQFNSFIQAIIVVVFLIIGIVLLLFFTNGMVALEYFSFFKIFSFRTIDESALTQRITSINNVFVYGFLSILIATNLIVFKIYSIGDNHPQEWVEVLADVFMLSVGILVSFLVKIIIINFSSYFFKVGESGPNQFFNFVRLLLGCFSISSICLLVIFMTNGNSEYWRPIILSITLLLLGLFIITTFIKLLNRGGFTVFHLFSYICISEIFPALLLLNVTIH